MAEWSVPLNEFFDEAEREIEAESISILKDIASFLVDVTPFRTGQLKGGYQASLNGDPPFARPPDDKGGQITIALLHAVADQFKIGDEYKIVNYTFHGPFVNDGTVNMPGQFMIERTVDHIVGE